MPAAKTGDIRQVALWGVSPDGQTLAYTYSACATCGMFLLQTAGDERVLGRWEGWPAWPGPDFSPDGRYALIRLDQGGAVLSGQTLVVFDLLEERTIYQAEAERNDFGPAVFLGSDVVAHFRLAYGFDKQGAAVNTISLEIITIPDAQAMLYPVAVIPAWQSGSPVAAASPDGKLLAFSYGSGTLWLVDAGSGRIVRNWQAHADEIRSLAFSPDGLSLASFGLDGLVKVWSVK